MKRYQYFTIFKNNVKLIRREDDEENTFVNNLQITLDADLKRLFFINLERVFRSNDFRGAVIYFSKFVLYDRMKVIEGKRKFIMLHKLLVLRNIVQEYGVSKKLVLKEYFNRWNKYISVDEKNHRLKKLLLLFKEKVKYKDIKGCLFDRIKKTGKTGNTSERGLRLFDVLYNVTMAGRYWIFKLLYSYKNNKVDRARSKLPIEISKLLITKIKMKSCFYTWLTQVRGYMSINMNIIPQKALLIHLLKSKIYKIYREIISEIYLYSYNNEKADGLVIHKNLYFYENNYNHILLRMINGFYKIYRLKKERKRYMANLGRNRSELRNYFLLWCCWIKNISKERQNVYGSYNGVTKIFYILDRGLRRLKFLNFEEFSQKTSKSRVDLQSVRLILCTIDKSYNKLMKSYKEQFLKSLLLTQPCVSVNLLSGIVLKVGTKIHLFVKNMKITATKHIHFSFKEFKGYYSQKLFFIKTKKSINLLHNLNNIFQTRKYHALKSLKLKFYKKRPSSFNIDHSILTNTAVIIQYISSSIYKKARNLKLVKAIRALNGSRLRNNALAGLSNKFIVKYFILWKENIVQEKLALLNDIKTYNDINVVLCLYRKKLN
jgi:hypothetical protein